MAAQVSRRCRTRRSKAFVDPALGQRRIYVNECHGLATLPPADEFFDDGHFPWFAGAVPGDRTRSAPSSSSLSRARRGAAAICADGILGIGENNGRGSTTASTGVRFSCGIWRSQQTGAERCPETAKVLESLPVSYILGRAPSAFFLDAEAA